jgi:S-formylglutathione hydrolase FrmB
MSRVILALLILLLAVRTVPAGASEVKRDESFQSPALGHALHYAIYLPDGLEAGAPVPVIYLLHGADGKAADWIDQGHVQETADALIQQRKLPKVIIVVPDAGNSWYVDSPPSGMGAMGTAISEDLPNWIEQHYPVETGRHGRAIAGNSMGGFGALRFALAEPQRWAAAAALSGAFWNWLTPDMTLNAAQQARTQQLFQGAFGDPFDPKLMIAASPLTYAAHLPKSAPPPPVLLICGREDDFHLDHEQSTVETALRADNIPVTAVMTEGHHDWPTWSANLPRVLEFLGSHLGGAAVATAGHSKSAMP